LADPAKRRKAQFGSSVALSSDGGTALIVGSAPWVFSPVGSTWSHTSQRLTKTVVYGPAVASVALSAAGNTALIGDSPPGNVALTGDENEARVFVSSPTAMPSEHRVWFP
jgi:hypothetical protein